ncbi:MAG: peptidylprolyl isomerase [Bradymonadia bacterium]
MREKSQNFGIYFLFAILIFVFIFLFGPQSEGCQGSSAVQARVGWAATVANAELTQEEVEVQLKRKYRNLSDLSAADLAQLRREVLMQLIDVTRMAQKAQSMGLAIDKETITNFIVSKDNPDFFAFAIKVGTGNTKDDFRFDVDTYRSVVRQVFGINDEEYRRIIEQELLVQRYMEFLTEQVQVSKAEAQEAYERRERKWNLEFVTFDAAKVTELTPATPEEGAAYAKANADEISKYYEDNKGVYVHDKEVKVRRILLKLPKGADDAKKAELKKKAEEILAEAKAEGADFEAIAREKSEGYYKNFGGDMGWRSSDNSPAEDYKVYAGLEKGQISAVSENASGFWIVKADDVKPAIDRKLDAVRDEIGQILASKTKRRTQAKADAEALLAKVKGGNVTLAELAKPAEEATPEMPKPEMPKPEMPKPEKEGDTPAMPKPETAQNTPKKPAFKVQETGMFNDDRPNWEIIPKMGKVPELAGVLNSLTKEKPQPGQLFEANDRFFVVRLKDAQDPNMELFEKEADDLTNRLRRQRQGQLVGQWRGYLFGQAQYRDFVKQRGLGLLALALPEVEKDSSIKVNTQAFPGPPAPPAAPGTDAKANPTKGG